jgi:hypothetical protein
MGKRRQGRGEIRFEPGGIRSRAFCKAGEEVTSRKPLPAAHSSGAGRLLQSRLTLTEYRFKIDASLVAAATAELVLSEGISICQMWYPEGWGPRETEERRVSLWRMER